jgi:OOP family OmpA-OmpF porin
MKRKLLVAPVIAVAFAGAAFAQDQTAPADAGAPPADSTAAPADTGMAPADTSMNGEQAAAPEAPASDESASSKPPSTSYLFFMGGYLFQDTKLFTDHTRKSSRLSGDNGGAFQVGYGQHGIGGMSGLGWELTLFGDIIETGKNMGTDFYRPGAGIDLVYSFGDRIGFTPFILVGGGGVYDDQFPDDFDKFGAYGNFGAGFVTGDLGKGVHLRGEGRYVYDSVDQVNGAKGIEDVRVSLGVEISLWDKPEVTVAPEAKTQVVEVVKTTGLEDSDGDGIVDSKDKCPGTPPNTRVDGDGCPLPKVLQLKGVTFEFNKDRLRPDSKTVLDTVVEIMKRYPDMKVEVAGHTDNVGSDSYNQKLSEKRAEAVRQYLINAGIASGNMTAMGYGEKEPIATNDTDEGRELNRRVELRIKN